MNKERANEIMRELKEECGKQQVCGDCIFYMRSEDGSGCKLRKTSPEKYKIDVLDEKEKEYLSNVVRPFKNKVKHIVKIGAVDEFIQITLDGESIDFPYFKRGTMYKGMERNKEYTLEELGI